MTLHIDFHSMWRKSSFSAEDSNCVEIALGTWRKSSFSAEDANCIEVAFGSPGPVEVERAGWCESTVRPDAEVAAIRDSKNSGGPCLVFPAEGLRALISGQSHF